MELEKQRSDILEDIKAIRVGYQALSHVKVQEHTYSLAKKFVKKAPNVCQLPGKRSVFLRYEVLSYLSAAGDYGVYDLLAEDAGKATVQSGDKFTDWQDAVKLLLRYALNLLLAPKRPEFQTIKVR